jgi:two-component system alkaline phosphatase synthesis response regulator PhoP
MTKTNHKTILLVDDEQDILDLLKYNLEKEGYNVHTANDGTEGFEKAKSLQPALILLDLMMPKMDGIEACGLIRQEASLNETLVVFLTSRSEDYSQVACLEAGADDFVTKPIRPRVLIAKISALLRRSERVENGNTLQSSSITINRDKFMVEVNGV